MSFKIIVALAFAASLSGCMTAEQQASVDDAKCRSFGATPGTALYYDCRMTMDAQNIAISQERGRGLREAGAQLMRGN